MTDTETNGVTAIMISGPTFNELQLADDIKNGNSDDIPEPEYFGERRNYIHG